MTDYAILHGETMTELREDVLALLADGWELAGGVAVTSWPSMSIDGPNRTELLFLQSLVKTTHED
jgi:hypothetical protein